MGQKKNVDMSMEETEVKVVEAVTEVVVEDGAEKKPAKKTTLKKKIRSQKYQAVRSQVDKTRLYDALSAVDLLKKLSYSSFDGTVVAHLVLDEKFQGERVGIQFPHSTGKSITVAIADEKLLAEVAKGKIEFDVLLATPNMMPKLAKLAKILGPKGLMPNPKQGTLIDNPKDKKKELESGKITIRSERKAPLMHIVIGNTKMETKELVENLQTLMKTLKDKINRISLAATMSPSIKVAVEK
jgi:large subunit ribosomal protein L1